MNADKILNIFGSIVVVAGITAVLMRGDAAAKVIGALGNVYTSGINAAVGAGR